MTEVHHRHWASRQVLFATLWLTLLVLTVKVWAGWATGSLSLLAESLHTLVDGFSTLLSLIAISSRHRIPGREFWSHNRLEAVMALLLVAFLGFACFNLLGVSLYQFSMMSQQSGFLLPVRISLQLIQILGVVVAISLCLAFFERYEARVLENPVLRLNATHILRDVWLTLLVLLGLLGVWQGYVWLDPLLAIFMVAAAANSCWRVLNWQLPLLVQPMAIAPEALARTVRQVDGVTHCYHIKSRGVVGRLVFIEMHIMLHPEFHEAAWLVSEQLEQLIRERYGPAQVKLYLEENRFFGQPFIQPPQNNTRPDADWN